MLQSPLGEGNVPCEVPSQCVKAKKSIVLNGHCKFLRQFEKSLTTVMMSSVRSSSKLQLLSGADLAPGDVGSSTLKNGFGFATRAL